MASIVTSAPSTLPEAARRSRRSGIVSCSQLPSATRLLCDYQALARREGRDQMQRGPSPGTVVATARGLGVVGHQRRRIGSHRRRPGLEAVRKQRRIDAVHQHTQPARAGNPVMVGQEAAKERQIILAPVGDVLEVVARSDRTADHQKQHFGQRMRHPPAFPTVLDQQEMVQKQPQTRLLASIKHGGVLRINAANRIRTTAIRKPPLTEFIAVP